MQIIDIANQPKIMHGTQMKLKTYLTQKQLSAKKFAAELGVATSTITRIIRGETSPHVNLAYEIQVMTKGRVKMADFVTDKETAE